MSGFSTEHDVDDFSTGFSRSMIKAVKVMNAVDNKDEKKKGETEGSRQLEQFIEKKGTHPL